MSPADECGRDKNLSAASLRGGVAQRHAARVRPNAKAKILVKRMSTALLSYLSSERARHATGCLPMETLHVPRTDRLPDELDVSVDEPEVRSPPVPADIDLEGRRIGTGRPGL